MEQGWEGGGVGMRGLGGVGAGEEAGGWGSVVRGGPGRRAVSGARPCRGHIDCAAPSRISTIGLWGSAGRTSLYRRGQVVG